MQYPEETNSDEFIKHRKHILDVLNLHNLAFFI